MAGAALTGPELVAYWYAPLRLSMQAYGGDRRTVAVLVVNLERRFIRLAHQLPTWHMLDQQGIVARNTMKLIEETLRKKMEVPVVPGEPSPLLSWWRQGAARREEPLLIAEPMPGITDDLEEEAERLLREYVPIDEDAPRSNRRAQ
jgi:hypothetical protein